MSDPAADLDRSMAKVRSITDMDSKELARLRRNVLKLAKNPMCANPNCEGPRPPGRSRCNPCASYFYRNGTERPEDLVIAHNRRKFENGCKR